MPSASINLRVQPFRLLSKVDAAHYCGLPIKLFEKVCPVLPLDMGRAERRWDVQDLDRWIDGKKGDHDDADDIVGRLA